jgi:hypothetical protein
VTGMAIDQKDTERIFQLFDASRQSGLRDAASFGGAGEVLLARQSKEKFKFINQYRAPTQSVAPRRNRTPPCEMLSQLMENPVVSQYS